MRRLRARTIAGLCAALVVLAAAAVFAAGAGATTEPQLVRLDTIVLSSKGVRISFTQVQRGALVVFKVHNASKGPKRFVIKPKSLGGGGNEGGSGFRTKLLHPGEIASFQIEFQVRAVFVYSAVGTGAKPVNGKFVVT